MTDHATSVVGQLHETIEERVEPEPDGVQNAESNIWTSLQRLKQEASKGHVSCSRDGVQDAVDRLVDDGRVIYWHGLIAPATDEHLRAIIENETQCGITRRLLIGKCNRLLESAGGESGD